MTVTMVSKSNAGMRYDAWSGEEYIEEIDLTGTIDCTRLNTLFLDHVKSTDTAVGRVTNPRIERGELLADISLDDKDQRAVLVKSKLESQILNDFSIGYEVRGYEVIEEKGKPNLMKINNLAVYELSVVGIGFDSGAQLKRSTNMPVITPKKETNTPEPTLEARTLEAERKSEIMIIAAEFKASESLKNRFLENGNTKDFMRAILEERKASQVAVPPVSSDNNYGYYTSTGTQEDARMRGAIDALAGRFIGHDLKDAHPSSRMFKDSKLSEILNHTGGSERGLSPQRMAERALSSPDLPILLKEAGSRALQESYELAAPSHALWTNEVMAPDFREQKSVNFSGAGELKRIHERSELKENKVYENAEQWELASYGDTHIITREAMINDDLGALERLFKTSGSRAARTVNNHVYRLLQGTGEYSDYKMSDGQSIFHASHTNITDSALSAVSLSIGIKQMRTQKDMTGDYINLAPSYLIVGPEIEIDARVLVESLGNTGDNKNSSVSNPFNFLTVVVDANISGTQWFLSAGSAGIAVGTLLGNKTPITNIINQSVRQIEIETVFDFSVSAIDYRGILKGQ